MRPIREALESMMPAFAPLGPERVPLVHAYERFLYGPVSAREDAPPFDNSAMDGWAVRSDDLKSASPEAPVELTKAGEVFAGGAPPPDVQPGTAVRIFTGARVPESADAVVLQEHVTTEGDRVRFERPAKPDQHIRHRASDLGAHRPMLQAGARLSAGELGLLASQRYASVDVHRRPRVALLCTGDELRDVGDPAEPGTIVNSNAYALRAQIEEAGGVPWVLPNVPDDPKATEAAVRSALSADVVISVGGASVGEHDYVRTALEAAGVTLNFWKVKMKPGKPLIFGTYGSVPIVGLPGNPVSALVTFELFVRPGLRQMLGDRGPYRPRIRARLARDHRHSPGRTELARATLHRRDNKLEAAPLRLQGSGSLPSVVGFDALLVLPPDVEHFEAGTELDAIAMNDRRSSAEPPVRD
jgi:molybdopterin molybdotransferase